MQYPNSGKCSYFIAILVVYITWIIRPRGYRPMCNLLLSLGIRGMAGRETDKYYQTQRGGALGGYGVKYSVISALETSPPQISALALVNNL